MDSNKDEQGNLKKNLQTTKLGNAQSKETGKTEKNGIDIEKHEEPGEKGKKKVKVKFENTCNRLGINPNLFFLKISLFVMYGATAALLPYLTIHMQSIGLTVEDIAIVYLALPLTTFLAPPLTGFLVDKMGNYKPVVILSLVLNLIFHHSLLFIPHQEMPGMMPAAYVVRHPATGKVEVWWSPCPSRECPDEEELDMVVDNCEDYCLLEDKVSKPRKHPVLPSDIAVMPPTLLNLKNPVFHGVQLGEKEQKPRSNKVKVKKKDKDAGNSTQEDLRFHFDQHNKKETTGLCANWRLSNRKPRKKHKKKEKKEESAFFYIGLHKNLGDPIEQLGLEIEPDEDEVEPVTDFRTRFGPELLMEAGVNVTALEEFDLRCGGLVLATNLTLVKLKDLAADCMLQKCNFIEGGPEVCPPDYKESDDRIFWIYFALRFIGTTMLSGCVTIMDPIALVLIQQYGGEFGRERLFSSIGMAIFSPLTGVLIDYNSEDLGYTDYSAAFYTYDALLAISIITVAIMPLAPRLPADNILMDTLAIIKMPHVVLFILFLFLLGNFWGFIESYAFLYLKELGASNYLLGITVTIGTISSMPFLYGAEKITKKFGHINIIVSAFFLHAVRLMGYSFIEEPWWCFPFEAMEALAVHLMWIAAATYCALLAPKNLLATLIGVLGMAHFSLGRGSGSFVGGLLIGTVGTRKSFRIMGLIAITGGFCYFILHYFWLRKLKVVKELEAQYAEENEEKERLKRNADGVRERPIMKDVAISAERLSLMIEFHNRGSITSLDRSNSYLTRGSASKVDSLRNLNSRRNSNPALMLKHSTPNLRRHGSLGKDRMNKDSTSSISQLPIKKSVDTLSTLDEVKLLKESNPILEEEEGGKDETFGSEKAEDASTDPAAR
ncbi:UNVERIFIED_CONTAM: hypothetical protein PYX00_005990 [Menopon gallinae]|uniref:Major facilitator superfamily associated domain-containing protein n=1 Tax=Menopon gallinae TaxID=328185 RepID=A0AAW2HUQ5_9NEOP